MSSLLAFIGMPGHIELLIVGGIVLLLFGGSKIPKLMRGLGEGVTEFKKGVRGIEDEVDSAVNSPVTQTSDTQDD